MRVLLLGRKLRTGDLMRTDEPVLWPAQRISVPELAEAPPGGKMMRRAFKVTYTAKAAEESSQAARRRSE
jgi:hypothetical protein